MSRAMSVATYRDGLDVPKVDSLLVVQRADPLPVTLTERRPAQHRVQVRVERGVVAPPRQTPLQLHKTRVWNTTRTLISVDPSLGMLRWLRRNSSVKHNQQEHFRVDTCLCVCAQPS